MILGQTIDINGNIIQKAKFEPLASDPSASVYLGSLSGAIYYNTTSGVNRIHNGSEWVNIVNIQGTGNNINVTYSGNPLVATINLSTTGTAGTYTKVTTDAYGRVTSGTTLLASDLPSGIDATKIADGSVTSTEFQYINSLSANAQSQLNTLSANKANTTSLSAYQLLSEKGIANGYASLDLNAKVPTSQLPEEILGNMKYKGTWNATTNTPTITTATSANTGWYYIVSVSGTYIPSGLNPITSGSIMSGTNQWNVGDWIVSDGTYWDKIDNTDQVMSIFGRTGTVIATNGDYTASQITNVPSGNIASTTVQAALNELDSEKVPTTTQVVAGTGLTGGSALSANVTISMPNIGTPGTYTKVSTDAQGRVSAATNITSADVPTLGPSKIQQDSTNRFVSDTQIGKWDSVYNSVSGTSASWNAASISAHNHGNKTILDQINQSVATSANVLFSSVSATNISATSITVGSIDNTEFGYLNGTSANIQNQLTTLSGSRLFATNGSDNRVATFSNSNTLNGESQLTFDGSTLTISATNTRLDIDGPFGTKAIRFRENGTVVWAIGETSGQNFYINDSVVGDQPLYIASGSTGSVTLGTANRKINIPNLSTSAVVVTDGSKNLVSSPITTTELGYLAGVTSNIQTQLNNKITVNTHNIGNGNLGSGYIKFASFTLTSSAVNYDTVFRWLFDGRTIVTESMFKKATVYLAIRRETNNTINGYSFYVNDTGIKLLDELTVRTNDNVNFDCYLKSDDTGYRSYFTVTTEMYQFNSGSYGAASSFVATSAMPVYSTILRSTQTGLFTTTSDDFVVDTSRPIFYKSGSDSYLKINGSGGNQDFIKFQDTDNSYRFFGDATEASSTANALIYAGGFYDTSFTNGKVLVSNTNEVTESSITSTELGYLSTTSANIQTQLNNLKNGSSTRYTTTINIVVGAQSFTITHNLGYLRPTVKVIEEVSDREILTTPIYTSVNQLSLPITSSQAFTGVVVEVSV